MSKKQSGSPLGSQTWPDASRATTLLVPLGSTEQHGPHLPLDTDSRIAVAVAQGAAQAADELVVVAPVLPYGASGEHRGFAGTISIGTEALHHVLVELVRSASESFERIIFVNGHGGNHDGVKGAVEQMAGEGHEVVAWWPRIPNGDAHAGRTETSLLLAIAPDVVRLEAAEAGNTAPVAELFNDLRSGGVRAVAANGVLGDPAGASADEGAELLANLVLQLGALL
jgi:creatinine amidohydrolase